jgi:5'-deoxynucleotidase YfbR-like HD superfamily hydrolase
MGDLLPEERNQGKLREEKNTYGYISALSTFAGVGDLERVRTLWDAFENRKSENARIARDLDRLECLTQLYIYGRRSKTLTDRDPFEADLIGDIHHRLTLGILAASRALRAVRRCWMRRR